MLSRSEQALHEAQRIANLGSYTYEIQGNRWSSSNILDEIFGIDQDFPRDAAHWLMLVVEDMRQEVQDHLKSTIEQHRPFDHEYRIIRPSDGKIRWVHGKGQLQLDDQGCPVLLVGTVQDITAQRQAEEALRNSEANFRNFFEENSSVMMLVDPDTHAIIGANKAATEYYGYSLPQLVGMSMDQINVMPTEQVAEDRQSALRGEKKSFFFAHRQASGKVRDVEVFFSPIVIHDGRSLLFAIVHDITARMQMEKQVHQLAFYDPLTQLPNRRLLNDRINLVIAACKRSGNHGALMFMDLDNFKPMNDTYGHEMGDALLVEVAARLKKCVREIDTVARLGGDEFVLIIGDLDKTQDKARVQAEMIAEKVRASLAEPYALEIRHEGKLIASITHYCSTSIGIVVFVDGTQDVLVKCADMAMYQAKELGRNKIRFYSDNV